LRIRLAVSTEYRRVSDRQTETDGQTTCDSIVRVVKTNEPIQLQISTSSPRGMGMKCSTLGSGGQRSRSHDAEVRFGELAEASFSTPSVE